MVNGVPRFWSSVQLMVVGLVSYGVYLFVIDWDLQSTASPASGDSLRFFHNTFNELSTANLLCGYLDHDSGRLLAINMEKLSVHFSRTMSVCLHYLAFCFGVPLAGRVPYLLSALQLTRDMTLIRYENV